MEKRLQPPKNYPGLESPVKIVSSETKHDRRMALKTRIVVIGGEITGTTVTTNWRVMSWVRVQVKIFSVPWKLIMAEEDR
jgi:hypothetical protein